MDVWAGDAVGGLGLAALGPSDLSRIAGWLARPHVRTWLGAPAPRLAALAAAIENGACRSWRLDLGSRPIGWAVGYPLGGGEIEGWGGQPPGTHALELVIGEADCLGRGYGRDTLRRLVEVQPAGAVVRRLAVSLDPANVLARHCYGRAGFVEAELVRAGARARLVMARAP